MAYTTTDLLASVRRRAQLPAANGALTTTDLLALADLAHQTVTAPLLRSVREEYGVISESVTIVSGQRAYPIPTRAEAGSLRDVIAVSTSTGAEVQLPYIPPEDRPFYREAASPWWDAPCAYTVEGNDIEILPTPTTQLASTYMLRMRYYLRVGRFVETSACDVVLTYSAPTVTTTAASVFSTGDFVDVIGASPPFRPRVIGSDVTVVGAAVDLDAASAILEAPVAGDYVCATDTTCVLQMPVELHRVLETATVAEVYRALGYQAELDREMALLQGQMQAVRVLMEPRTEGGTRVILNPRSTLRRGRRIRW